MKKIVNEEAEVQACTRLLVKLLLFCKYMQNLLKIGDVMYKQPALDAFTSANHEEAVQKDSPLPVV